LASGAVVEPPAPAEKWKLIRRHCQLVVEEWEAEDPAMRSMRARLMAYSRGFPNSKMLREKFQHVASLAHLDAIIAEHLQSASEPERLAAA